MCGVCMITGPIKHPYNTSGSHIQNSEMGGLTLESTGIPREHGSSYTFTISSNGCEGINSMEE